MKNIFKKIFLDFNIDFSAKNNNISLAMSTERDGRRRIEGKQGGK